LVFQLHSLVQKQGPIVPECDLEISLLGHAHELASVVDAQEVDC
jgi:hypothetical protein